MWESEPNTRGATRNKRSRIAGKHVHIKPAQTSIADHHTIPHKSHVGLAVDAYRTMDWRRRKEMIVTLIQVGLAQFAPQLLWSRKSVSPKQEFETLTLHLLETLKQH